MAVTDWLLHADPSTRWSVLGELDAERREGLRVLPAARSRDAEEQLNRPKVMRATPAQEQQGNFGTGPVPEPLSADVA